MSKKKYKVKKNEDCLTFRELLARWPNILEIQLENILKKSPNGPILQSYVDIREETTGPFHNVLYLTPLEGIGIEFRNKGLGYTLHADGKEASLALVKQMKTSDTEDIIYFLKADVEKQEEDNPEYIDINKAIDSEVSSIPTIEELQAENERLKATIERYEAERQQQIATPANDKLDTFFKTYPLIALVKEYHDQGFSNAEIGLKLTKELNPSLTVLQAGVLIADDTSSRIEPAIKTEYYRITKTKQPEKKSKPKKQQ